VECFLPLTAVLLMATVQKNMSASGPGPGKLDGGKTSSSASPIPETEELSPASLQQEYADLQERFQRTTNALGSAAHDLKTPLAILNGYVELLQSEKLGSLNARQREVPGDIQESGKRLQQFIQDFLGFSVLEIGEMKMHFEPADINACLSEVC